MSAYIAGKPGTPVDTSAIPAAPDYSAVSVSDYVAAFVPSSTAVSASASAAVFAPAATHASLSYFHMLAVTRYNI